MSQPDPLRERLEGLHRWTFEEGGRVKHLVNLEDVRALLASAPAPAVTPRCVGFPDCDGDLPGEAHSRKCPLFDEDAWDQQIESEARIAEAMRVEAAEQPAAPVEARADESQSVPLEKLPAHWDGLEAYYQRLADDLNGEHPGYDHGSFTGKAIGISICAAQLKAAIPAALQAAEQAAMERAAQLVESVGGVVNDSSNVEDLIWSRRMHNIAERIRNLASPAAAAQREPNASKV
jgi:hypothetical protein